MKSASLINGSESRVCSWGWIVWEGILPLWREGPYGRDEERVEVVGVAAVEKRERVERERGERFRGEKKKRWGEMNERDCGGGRTSITLILVLPNF